MLRHSNRQEGHVIGGGGPITTDVLPKPEITVDPPLHFRFNHWVQRIVCCMNCYQCILRSDFYTVYTSGGNEFNHFCLQVYYCCVLCGAKLLTCLNYLLNVFRGWNTLL